MFNWEYWVFAGDWFCWRMLKLGSKCSFRKADSIFDNECCQS